MDRRREFERIRIQLAQQLPKSCCNCENTTDLHIHHIVPLALGGTNKLSNLAVLCSNCHRKTHGINREYNHLELVMAGKEAAMQSGRWCSGRVLYGYTAGSKKGEVIIDQEESEIVRIVYRWKYVFHFRLVEICEMLTSMAINPRNDNSKWEVSSVKQILSRPNIYLGCKHKNVEFPRILDEEYRETIDTFVDPHKRRKRTYAGKVLQVESRIIYGKALEQSGVFSIA